MVGHKPVGQLHDRFVRQAGWFLAADAPPGGPHGRGVRPDFEPVPDGEGAGELELGAALDLDEAHPAAALDLARTSARAGRGQPSATSCTADRVRELGADRVTAATRPADAVERGGIIVTMVANDQALEEVVHGIGGFGDALGEGGLDLLLVGGHLRARAAVQQHDLLRAAAARGPGRVDGGVAAADDHDLLSGQVGLFSDIRFA